MERVLDLWREAERDLIWHEHACRERQEAAADVERLRWLYQSIVLDSTEGRFRLKGADRAIVEAMAFRMHERMAPVSGESPCEPTAVTAAPLDSPWASVESALTNAAFDLRAQVGRALAAVGGDPEGSATAP